jgi:hypothetical protein
MDRRSDEEPPAMVQLRTAVHLLIDRFKAGSANTIFRFMP